MAGKRIRKNATIEVRVVVHFELSLHICTEYRQAQNQSAPLCATQNIHICSIAHNFILGILMCDILHM